MPDSEPHIEVEITIGRWKDGYWTVVYLDGKQAEQIGPFETEGEAQAVAERLKNTISSILHTRVEEAT